MIILSYTETDTNACILQLWIDYYTKQNIPFCIYSDTTIDIDIDPKYTTHDVSLLTDKKNVLLTEYDFIFSYTKNERDVMMLSTDITKFDEEESIIGRVFYVPVPNKKDYTTFEIPDFILYKHENHTNYTLDGIRVKGGENVSDSFVCLSLQKSRVAMDTEYYENDILFHNKLCNVVHNEYALNIYVNKAKKYGIIWHHKCACSTITEYFCKVNNLEIFNCHNCVSPNDNIYKFNVYLQGFDIVSFIRHPFLRFISCYFNKHINKFDAYYLNRAEYINYLNKFDNKDSLYNFADYLQSGNSVDNHSLPITKMLYFTKYPQLNYQVYNIDENLHQLLFTFFSKYHKDCKQYTLFKNVTEKMDIQGEINTEFKHFTYDEWIEFKNVNGKYPNYLQILDNDLSDILSEIYKQEMICFQYKGETCVDVNAEKFISTCLPEDFDVNTYKELNEDLKKLKDVDAKKHYVQHGIHEKRHYKVGNLPEDFDVKSYKQLNVDLESISDTQAKQHYVQHGIHEKRHYKIENLPEDFDVNSYKQLNVDLESISDTQAKQHYVQHGIHEKRDYSNIFFNCMLISDHNNPFLNKCGDDDDDYENVRTLKENFNDIQLFDSHVSNVDKTIFSYENLVKYYSQLLTNCPMTENIQKEGLISLCFPKGHYSVLKIHTIKQPMFSRNKFLNVDLLYVHDSYLKKDIYVIYPFLQYPIFEKKIIIIDDLKTQEKIWDYNIINLEHRHDNLRQCMNNINNLDWLSPKRFNAIRDKRGYIGCTLSHLAILKTYKNKNENVLIVEDDNLILDATKLQNILLILDTNQFEWDIFLGTVGNYPIELKGVVYVNGIELLNIVNFTKTNFVYYNKNIIDKIISLNEIFDDFNSLLRYYDRFLNLFNVFTSYDVCIMNNKFSEIELINNIREVDDTLNVYKILKRKENIYWGLPEDFEVNIYKDLNEDLKHITDLEAKEHYVDHGKYEHRKYKAEKLPEDFDVKIYKELNDDMKVVSDTQAKQHYVEHGIHEKRHYKVGNLPEDFDIKMYKEINEDLINMTDLEAKQHFLQRAKIEGRVYQDIYFDTDFFCTKYNCDRENAYYKYNEDIRQEKNPYFAEYVNGIKILPHAKYIFLVNHDDHLYGASHYIYSLFLFLQNKYKTQTDVIILLCEFTYNVEIFNKYKITEKDVLEYKGDPTLLYMLYDKLQPKVVYLNSCNIAIYKVYKFFPENVRILHSHEIKKHYLLNKKLLPDYVVSDVIANQYEKNPSIQPPFLLDIAEIVNFSNEKVEEISNTFGKMDTSKITIGMCGQINERKNFSLFIEMSTQFPAYNFLWIGDTKNVFEKYNNIFHIQSTINPYKYFKQVVDYFILFSREDPCPYVILENILLETNIITFTENIFYHHKNQMLAKTYFSYDGCIDKMTCIDAINKFVKNKKTITTNNGVRYIQQYFSSPTNIEKELERRLL